MMPDHFTMGNFNVLFRLTFVSQKDVEAKEKHSNANLSQSSTINESTQLIKEDCLYDQRIVNPINIITKRDVCLNSVNPFEKNFSIVSLIPPPFSIVNIKLKIISNTKKFMKICGILSIKLQNLLNLINLSLPFQFPKTIVLNQDKKWVPEESLHWRHPLLGWGRLFLYNQKEVEIWRKI